jgi:hypothetical protein
MRQIVFGAADSIDAVGPMKRRDTADANSVKDLIEERPQRSHAVVAGCLHIIYGLTTLAFVFVVISNLVQARFTLHRLIFIWTTRLGQSDRRISCAPIGRRRHLANRHVGREGSLKQGR